MVKNEGEIDRVVRITIGLAVLSQVFWGLETSWALIGLVPLATGITGFCPGYRLLGFTTCPLKAVIQRK